MEDAIPNGCIPVLVMDNVSAVLQPAVDWTAFSVRIAEVDIPNTPQILLSIPPARIREMQVAISRVWHRFVYTSGPKDLAAMVKLSRDDRKAAAWLSQTAADALQNSQVPDTTSGNQQQLLDQDFQQVDHDANMTGSVSQLDTQHVTSESDFATTENMQTEQDAVGSTGRGQMDDVSLNPLTDAESLETFATMSVASRGEATRQTTNEAGDDADRSASQESNGDGSASQGSDEDALLHRQTGGMTEQGDFSKSKARRLHRKLMQINTDRSLDGADDEVVRLIEAVNSGGLLPQPSDGSLDATNDAFGSIMQVLYGRVENLKRGEVVFSERLAL